MHWRMRGFAGTLALTLVVFAAPATKPAQAESCAELNGKIAAAEAARSRLRALVQAFASYMGAQMQGNVQSESGTFVFTGREGGGLDLQVVQPGEGGAPAYALLAFRSMHPNFEAELQQARQDVAATPESELQQLRALRIRQCSGQMASAPPGSTYSPLQRYLPQPQVYGYPAVSPAKPARTTRTYRSRSTTVRSASVKRKASTRKSVRASKPTKARTKNVRARNVRNTRSAQSRQGQRRQAAVKRPQGRTHVAKPGIIRDPPR